MNAASISRALRAGGLNPLGSGTPRTREGVRVKESGDYVRIVVDIDSSVRSARVALDVELILFENFGAIRVDREHNDGIHSFSVLKGEA